MPQNVQFRTLIRQADLSHGELAVALGVDPAYVSNWVHGKRLASVHRYAGRLGQLLGVSADEILRVTGAPNRGINTL